MKRQGAFYDVLGQAARSAAFSLDPAKLPDSARPAYGTLRDAFRTIRRLAGELPAALAQIRSNADLTPEARERREREALEVAQRAVQAAAEGFKKAAADFHLDVEKRIRETVARDPLAGPPVRWESFAVGAEREGAKLQHAIGERLAAMARAMARDRVDRLIDQALDDKAGLAIERAWRRALDLGDPLVLHELEGYGRRRILIDGNEAQRAVLEQVLAASIEERMDDDTRALCDHADALASAEVLIAAVNAEAAQILETGKSATLTGAEKMLGAALTGAEARG